MRSVRISLRLAKTIEELLPPDGLISTTDMRAVEQFRAALKPKRAVSASRVRRVAKRKTKKEETAEIRAEVFARAGKQFITGATLCEACDIRRATDLHHGFGRARVAQAAENCLAVCRPCHDLFTQVTGGAPEAWEMAARAFASLGLLESARLAQKARDWAQAKAELSEGTP